MLGSLNSKIVSLENTHILRYFQDIFDITFTTTSEFTCYCKENNIKVIYRSKDSAIHSKQILIYKQDILINTIDMDINISSSNVDVYSCLIYSVEYSKELISCLNT